MDCQELRRQQYQIPTKAAAVCELVEKLSDEKYQLLENSSQLQARKNRLDKDVVVLKDLLRERNESLLSLQEKYEVLKAKVEKAEAQEESPYIQMKLESEGYPQCRRELYKLLKREKEEHKGKIEELEAENDLLIMALEEDVKFSEESLEKKVRQLQCTLAKYKSSLSLLEKENKKLVAKEAQQQQQIQCLKGDLLQTERNLASRVKESVSFEQQCRELKQEKQALLDKHATSCETLKKENEELKHVQDKLIVEKQCAMQRAMTSAFSASMKEVELEKVKLELLEIQKPSETWAAAGSEIVEEKDTIIASLRMELDKTLEKNRDDTILREWKDQVASLKQQLHELVQENKLLNSAKDEISNERAAVAEQLERKTGGYNQLVLEHESLVESNVKLSMQCTQLQKERGALLEQLESKEDDGYEDWSEKCNELTKERDDLLQRLDNEAAEWSEKCVQLAKERDNLLQRSSNSESSNDTLDWAEKCNKLTMERDALFERLEVADETKCEQAHQHQKLVDDLRAEVFALRDILELQVEASGKTEHMLDTGIKGGYNISLDNEEEETKC